MNKHQPPHFARRFFRWYCDPRLEEQILGDLEEQFEEDLQQFGAKKAKRRFVWNVIRFFRKGIIKPVDGHQKLNQYTMLKHHFKLALRGFKRFKTSFAINLIGLSSGLACTLLIYLWVHDEWNMNKFHENDDRLYQVLQNINVINKIETIESTPARLGTALLTEFPSVENMASVLPAGSYSTEGILEYDEKKLKTRGHYSSAGYFEVFSFPLKMGKASEVLTQKNSVVISEDFSNKWFGEGVDPRGEELIWENGGRINTSVVVTGVFESLPSNTTDRFDVVFSLELFLDNYPHIRDWGNSDPSTFIVLSEDASPEQLNNQLKNYVASKDEGYRHTHMLQRYSDRYLYGKYQDGQPIAGRMQYVRLFSGIAILVLFIACINFMNLSTARASRRLKEIGVKKSFGVRRRSLIFQFFTETFLLSLISILVAGAIAWMVLPAFNNLTAKQLILSLDQDLLLFSLATLSITTLLAGSYPALYLSSFQPIAILKGKLTGTIGDLWARKGLVILQYCASAILITSVWIISSQVHYVQNKNLGFNKEQVIYFEADGKLDYESSEIFVDEVKKLPGVINAAGFSHDLLGDVGKTTGVSWDGKDPESKIRFGNLEVGFGLIETFGMEMAQGRAYSREFGDDDSKIILNEKAIEVMGMEDPIGKTFTLWRKSREIIGVVKNFHFESLHEEIKPCFFQVFEGHGTIVIRISPGNEMQTIERIEDLYHAYNPALTFNFTFFDQEYDALYKSEQQVASLSTYFAGIAIIISCLGLFGLVAFTAEKKQKEIGIRKVLGASVLNLVFLLSNDFARIIFLAIMIALPVSYWLMKLWLDSFVYRIELHFWFFVGSGLLALIIAIITMSAQTMKAALANPINSLKDE
ncbi:MAG: FtsX-like permease family protein [Bacteroidota bacterium]